MKQKIIMTITMMISIKEVKQTKYDRVRTDHGKPGKPWNLIVGRGKSSQIRVCVGRKLLQVLMKGQASWVRKYPETIILLGLAGFKMIITNSALRVSLVNCHFISSAPS